MATRLEREFQADLIKELRLMFPGCFLLKNDANYQQGIPDLVIMFGQRWALLEVKKSADAPARPNQEYYVAQAAAMSFGVFIYPENKNQVLSELIAFFR